MDRRPVLVAGGGIGGLSVALTLHQIGVPCLVLESVQHLQPLGIPLPESSVYDGGSAASRSRCDET
jgi:2-polyprenyl-6-methoxyphenol hydroxylase-like FAD-dependent oxidoreductase